MTPVPPPTPNPTVPPLPPTEEPTTSEPTQSPVNARISFSPTEVGDEDSSAPTASPVADPTPAPVAATTPSPVVDPTPAPVAATTPSPVADPTPAPVASTTPSPVADSTPAPVAATTPSPVADPTPAPVTATTTPSPVADPTPAPVTATTPSPVADLTPAPVTATTPSPGANDLTPAPVAVTTPSPVADPTPAPVEDPTESPVGPTPSPASSAPSESDPETSPPTLLVDEILPGEPSTPVEEMLREYALEGGVEFMDPNSYQYAALERLNEMDRAFSMVNSDPAKLVQHYALYCIFEATNSKPNDVIGTGTSSSNIPAWRDATGWEEPGVDPCDGWFGIECDVDGKIISIDLRSNDLSGYFPREVLLLASEPSRAGLLHTLDLYDNDNLSNGGDSSWVSSLGPDLSTYSTSFLAWLTIFIFEPHALYSCCSRILVLI